MTLDCVADIFFTFLWWAFPILKNTSSLSSSKSYRYAKQRASQISSYAISSFKKCYFQNNDIFLFSWQSLPLLNVEKFKSPLRHVCLYFERKPKKGKCSRTPFFWRVGQRRNNKIRRKQERRLWPRASVLN